jgi:hypothetical protein
LTKIYPPIPDRTTEQLLDIVETKEQWRQEVIDLAQKELIKRGVPIKTQETRRTIRQKFRKRIERVKARATYSTGEQIFIALFGLVLILIFQNPALFHSGPGYKKKNRQGLFSLLAGVAFWVTVYYINDLTKN